MANQVHCPSRLEAARSVDRFAPRRDLDRRPGDGEHGQRRELRSRPGPREQGRPQRQREVEGHLDAERPRDGVTETQRPVVVELEEEVVAPPVVNE